MVKINESIVLDLETAGRRAVTDRQVAPLRERFHLSVRRLAELLGTASPVVARWETNPLTGTRMHTTSAVRLAELMIEASEHEAVLSGQDVALADLVPISQVTGELGLSPSSKLINDKCQSGELTCYRLGRFGVYLPYAQAMALLHQGV